MDPAQLENAKLMAQKGQVAQATDLLERAHSAVGPKDPDLLTAVALGVWIG